MGRTVLMLGRGGGSAGEPGGAADQKGAGRRGERGAGGFEGVSGALMVVPLGVRSPAV